MQKLKMMDLQFCTLICTLLLIQGSFTVRGCQYWYVQQPPSEFHCSPYGSKLQLYCVATGPSLPEFHIQWYSGRSVENPVQLASGEGYTIQTTVLDSGLDVRTSSSVLQTTTIGEGESGACFWCQIEFGGEPLPVVSSMMCIQNESAYSAGLPSCREALLPSGTPLCADSLISQRQQVAGEVHSSVTVLPEPTSSLFVASKASTSIGESLVLVTSSQYLLTSTEVVSPTLASSGVDPSVTASTSPATPVLQNRSEGSGNDSNLGVLYAAVAVCVIFVIVIVILVVVIVVLCGRRKKRSANEVAFSPRPAKARHAAAVTGPLLRNAFSEPSVVHPIHECGVPNSRLITNRSCSPADSSKTDPVRKIRGNSSSDHDYSDIDDMPPSKPLTQSPSGEETDTYDHLQPVEDEQESEKAGEASREHFYHTLEGKSQNKIYRSQKTSPPSLPQDTTDSADYDEVYEPPLTSSLEEMFDDPKYAALFNHNNRGKSAEPAENAHNNQRARFGGALSVSQPNIALIHHQNAYDGARGKRYRHFRSGTTSPQRHEIAVAIEIHKN